MATGRTNRRWARFYADGYDLSGYTRTFGPLAVEMSAQGEAALTDEVKNVLNGIASISAGTLNGFFDNTALVGLHVVASGAGVKRVVMAPIGMRAAPAAGDPVFMGHFEQLGYAREDGDSFSTVSIPFGEADAVSPAPYVSPWGVLLHASGSENTASTAVGLDDNGAATAFGGFMVYQVFSGDGTATIKIQDAATNTNPNFADLAGATSGVIDCSSPTAGLVALGTTATVRQFLRWQIALGTANAITFALSFHRAKF